MTMGVLVWMVAVAAVAGTCHAAQAGEADLVEEWRRAAGGGGRG